MNSEKKVFWLILLVLSVVPLFFFSCKSKNRNRQNTTSQTIQFDLDSIRKRGKLILLTENSATTYYLYKNQQCGFDYEMMKAFAKDLGVKLEVKLLDDVDKMFEMLNSGEGDIIASNLTVTKKRKEHVEFSKPLYQTRQVLVQRKFSKENRDSSYTILKDSTELHKVVLSVHKFSSFYERLKELEFHSGKPFQIDEIPGAINTEDLLRLANDGEIEATITDENLAIISVYDFPDLDMSVPISPKQDIAWAMRKNSSGLINEVNSWLEKNKTKQKISSVYGKYFAEEKLSSFIKPFALPRISPGAISGYDSLFRKYAPQINWDWRMLAAVAYQESGFNPNAQSWSGASGLMQLMPATSIRFGCDSFPTPECSVNASVKYFKYLNSMWKTKIKDEKERVKFMLASYNIGQGHVLDAYYLAKEIGLADTIWDGNVAEALLLKQQEKYYTMPVVKHGYCHATEPYHYVGKVLAVFDHYSSTNKKNAK